MKKLFRFALRLVLASAGVTAGLYGVHRGQVDEKVLYGFERFIRTYLLNDPV